MIRTDDIDKAIDRADVKTLRRIVEFPRCACLGPPHRGALCSCRMRSKYVRDRMSYAALKRGMFRKIQHAKE